MPFCCPPMMDALIGAYWKMRRMQGGRGGENKANQTWTTSDTVHLESLQGAMPPNTRGSTRPSHSQNLAKPPVQQSHRPRAVTAHDNDNDYDNLDGAQSAPDEDPMELFLDLMLGTPILFYVEKDVPNREQIAKLIRVCIPCVNRSSSAVSLTIHYPSSDSWWRPFFVVHDRQLYSG